MIPKWVTAAQGEGDTNYAHWTLSHTCKRASESSWLTGFRLTITHGGLPPPQVIQSLHKRTTNVINQYDQIQMEMQHLYLFLHLQSFIDCRHLSCVQSSVEHALMFYLQNQLFKIRWSVFQHDPLPEMARLLSPGRE